MSKDISYSGQFTCRKCKQSFMMTAFSTSSGMCIECRKEMIVEGMEKNIKNLTEFVNNRYLNSIQMTNDPKDISNMEIAEIIAQRSKCVSYKVGCVIVKNDRPITVGYNGTPKGYKNCNEIFDEKDFDREEHHNFSEKFEIHGELNAIAFAARNGIKIEGGILYCTLQPCLNCIKTICQSGITKIVFRDLYDKTSYTTDTYDMLITAGISIWRIEEKRNNPCK